ncbi:hypothetical protein KSC_057130 [Ktedonobacter sp. SOSP1-52]|uniref:VOC family protein n=1 Tax=Ktedonobacter sp. SOSP1-52 TaxID=2778366 RepID=UPI001A30DB4D|nr:hypothetical protein KSC_057130 [Ktedonobacter sp. SOSP1-52]
MTRASWVELCVSNFEQSITWFENVLGFHVTARDANEYAELSRDETCIQLAADDTPYLGDRAFTSSSTRAARQWR